MAAKKKIIDIKGDWKKNSTGGKVITVAGMISLAGFTWNMIRLATRK